MEVELSAWHSPMMAHEHPVKGTLTVQDIADIHARFEALHAAMPFLRGLAPEERKRVIRAGESSHVFIRKSYQVGCHIQEYLPRNLDLPDLANNLALIEGFRSIQIAAKRLNELINDTYSLITDQAFEQALQIYRAAKYAEGPEGMEKHVGELRRRFRRRRRRPPVEKIAPTAPDASERHGPTTSNEQP